MFNPIYYYMGVKLSALVEKKSIEFDELQGKTLAIDFSNFAFQFLSSIRQQDGSLLSDSKGNVTSHLVGIWSRFTNLMQRDMKLAIVFDGKPPEQKAREREARYVKKEQAQELFHQAKQAGDRESMAIYARQFSFLTPYMVEESKKLLEAMGLPVIQAPSEADAQMAYLNKHNLVWASASADYDCLLHGTPRLLTNVTLSQKKKLPSGLIVKTTPELVELKTLLSSLAISQDQLICLALLVGTDYNEGVKGIGPKKALKLIKEHKTPEKVFKASKVDFDGKELMDVFKKMPSKKISKLSWKPLNETTIKKLLIDDHDFSEARITSTLNKLLKVEDNKQQTGLGNWS
jgi:flap endonuclease-1